MSTSPLMPGRLPSPSSRRAWVEILNTATSPPRRVTVALLAEGVGRNNYTPSDEDGDSLSPSSRRAWVEIRLIRLASLSA